MEWFSFGLDCLCLAGLGLLEFSFLSRFAGKRLRPAWLLAFLCLRFGLDQAGILLGPQAVAALELVMLYAVCRLPLESGGTSSWAAALLAVYVSRLSFGLMGSLESLLFPYVAPGPPLYAAVVLASVLALALCGLAYGRILRQLPPEGPYLWTLAPLALFLIAQELYTLSSEYGGPTVLPIPREPGRHGTLLALQALGLAALFTGLYACRRLREAVEAQTALDALERELRAQRNAAEQARLRWEGTQALRHDWKNHLAVLRGLLSQGETERAAEYLSGLSGVTDSLALPCRTGSPALDALLADKLALARSLNVETEADLVLPRPCRVDDMAWCIIFANALDNALQACEGLEGPRFLRASGKRQGDFYLLEFENSCVPGPLPALGTGLWNIKTAAERYGGAISLEKSEGRFRLDVLLDISAS